MKAIDIAIQRLGKENIINFRENEGGRSVRGTCKCPQCGKVSVFTACSDVNGVWVYCAENCPMNY